MKVWKNTKEGMKEIRVFQKGVRKKEIVRKGKEGRWRRG